MTAPNDERLESGGQRQRLGAEICEGLRDQNTFAAKVVRLLSFVLRITVRMPRAELTVACSRNLRLVDVVATLLAESASIGRLLCPESAIRPVVAERLHHVIYSHEVHNAVSGSLRGEPNNPIPLLCFLADFRFATRQRAVAKKRIRCEASIVLNDVGVELHLCKSARVAQWEIVAQRNGKVPLLGSSAPLRCNLIRVLANLFPGTLLGQSLLHSASLARLQVEGVALHILNDVFGHNLALEPTQGVLQRFAFLQSNFCHSRHPQAS